MIESKETYVNRALADERRKLKQGLELLDRCEALLHKAPLCAMRGASPNMGTLMIYGLSRPEVLETIAALGGKWAKSVNPTYPTKLDYKATIDGVNIEIYGAPPPESCQIVETQEYVPAHNVTKRTLVCK